MLCLDKNLVSLYSKIVSSKHPQAPIEAFLLIAYFLTFTTSYFNTVTSTTPDTTQDNAKSINFTLFTVQTDPTAPIKLQLLQATICITWAKSTSLYKIGLIRTRINLVLQVFKFQIIFIKFV